MTICKGHITEDEAAIQIIAAMRNASEDATRNDYMEEKLTPQEVRVASAVVSLLVRVVEHMTGPCVEHKPEIRGMMTVTKPQSLTEQLLIAAARGIGMELVTKQMQSVGRQMTAYRDAKSCPKCNAAVGVWCRTEGGHATIHEERQQQ